MSPCVWKLELLAGVRLAVVTTRHCSRVYISYRKQVVLDCQLYDWERFRLLEFALSSAQLAEAYGIERHHASILMRRLSYHLDSWLAAGRREPDQIDRQAFDCPVDPAVAALASHLFVTHFQRPGFLN